MKNTTDPSRKRKWLLTGGIGTSLVGFGLAAAIEVGFLKHEGEALAVWVPLGTLAITVFILGIVLMIKAGRYEQGSEKD